MVLVYILNNYWRFMRLLTKIGFLDVPEACRMSWVYWRWRFWLPRTNEEKIRSILRCNRKNNHA